MVLTTKADLIVPAVWKDSAIKEALGRSVLANLVDQDNTLVGQPGDTIHADYTVGAVAELREPTEEEKSAPLTEVTDTARGTSEAPPAAAIGRAVRAVASIESLDPTAQSATVKGPEGGLVTVHVEDPTVFNSLKVGQPIVVTFAEKLVLSVQPKS